MFSCHTDQELVPSVKDHQSTPVAEVEFITSCSKEEYTSWNPGVCREQIAGRNLT
jgi:hypothetical protein